MIIDKEYPATHSMSTSWFAVDCEGNVALLEFNEEGPVPTFVREVTFEEIILERLVDSSGKIRRSILTDEQALSLVSCFEFIPYVYSDDFCFFFQTVIRINPELKEEFYEVIAGFEHTIVILSEKEGLYLYDGFKLSEEEEEKIMCDRLHNKTCIISYAEFRLECTVEKPDDYPVWLAEGFEGIPMYIYAQEYWDTALKKIHTPKCIVNASQFVDEVKEVALYLPVSFKNAEQFQIPLYYPSRWMSERKIKNSDRRYHDLRISKGNEPFLLTAELPIINRMYWSYSNTPGLTYTFEPTVGIIGEDKYHIYFELPEYIFKYAFGLNYEMGGRKLSELLEYYRPYLLVVMDGVLSKLEEHYQIVDKKLIYEGEEYPIFTREEVTQRKDEILALARKRYRGKKDPIVIDNEDDRDNIHRY